MVERVNIDQLALRMRYREDNASARRRPYNTDSDSALSGARGLARFSTPPNPPLFPEQQRNPGYAAPSSVFHWDFHTGVGLAEADQNTPEPRHRAPSHRCPPVRPGGFRTESSRPFSCWDTGR